MALPYVRVDKEYCFRVSDSVNIVYYPAPERRRAPRDHIAAIVKAGCGEEIPGDDEAEAPPSPAPPAPAP